MFAAYCSTQYEGHRIIDDSRAMGEQTDYIFRQVSLLKEFMDNKVFKN